MTASLSDFAIEPTRYIKRNNSIGKRKTLNNSPMKNLNALIFAGIVFLMVAMGAYLYRPGKLRRVGFQFDCWGVAVVIHSKFQEKWIWTDDPEFLKKVEDWRRTLKRPEVNAALRQGGGRIVLEFKNGKKEEFLTHALGLRGPGSRVLLNGQHVFSEREPFSEFLRQIDPKDLK
jgi:hypothetical protein